MITFTHADLPVHEHRTWRSSSTARTPVVAFGPDTRRLALLLAAHLMAMGIALPDGRWGFSREWLLRWWTAWCQAVEPEWTIIFGAYSVSAPTLCELLALMNEQGQTCHVVLPEHLSLRHGAVLEEVGAIQVEGLPPQLSPLGTEREEAAEHIPTLPECSTAYFLQAALNTLTSEPERSVVATLYSQILERTFVVLDLDADPATLLRVIYSEAAQARSGAHLTLALHAIQAGCWATGIPAQIDPRRIMRLAGPTLLARADTVLWQRCCYQVDAQRGFAASMVTLGASIDELLSVDLAAASDWMVNSPWSPLPGPVSLSLQARIAARTLDGAAPTDPLLSNPEQPAPTRAAMSRWGRLAVEQHFAPAMGHRRPWRKLTADEQLHELGVEWDT